jgi:hypothetical protein
MSQVNAPPPVTVPLSVWTGDRMVIWGGVDAAGPVSTGGRYDPVYDVWKPITTSGAPSARFGVSVVWTGDRMIVWGGYSPGNVFPNSGSRYDPKTDTWSPTAGAPQARADHAAVWTGTRMLVWGGYTSAPDVDPDLNTGGIYDPVANSWAPMSTAGAAFKRHTPAAVWTGDRMVIWGGLAGGYSSSGGSYCGVFPAHFYPDADHDGYGGSGSSLITCTQPAGYVLQPGDCADWDAGIWTIPSEARDVRFNVDTTTLAWTAPAEPGAVSNVYDAIRSSSPADFTASATCLLTDSPSLFVTDETVPPAGATLSYLVRSQNGCLLGSNLGNASNGDPRLGLNCP